MKPRTHALYRFFDAAGDLLYIGITLDPGARWRQHRDDKPWWTQVATVTIETHVDRDAVLAAEKAAIKREGPRFNVVHNRGARPAVVDRLAPTYDSTSNVWKFRSRRRGGDQEYVSDLHLGWEVNGTAMSDDFYPWEATAPELLRLWARRYGKARVPIYWYIWPEHETAPFQTGFGRASETFLTYYSWPEHAHTGERLNFNRLPVMDGEWHEGRSTKGGFFQQATGWKPAPLQPFVEPAAVFDAAGLPASWLRAEDD